MKPTKDWYKNIVEGLSQACKEHKLEEWLNDNSLDIIVSHSINSKNLDSVHVILGMGGPYVYIDTEDNSLHYIFGNNESIYHLPIDMCNEILETVENWFQI